MNGADFTLDNGLRVVHHYDPTTSMAGLCMLYNVGARDDSNERTGMAHLMEHLMFGGSANAADFDGELERAGGSNNAWTSDDFTCYWDLMPAQNIETAFWLESDRLISPSLGVESLEVQRSVVMEEFKQVCLNKPYGDMGHVLRSMLYEQHPYRYPAIGKELGHIEKMTQEEVRQFFFSHYGPNNAVLSVAGNVSRARCEELAVKWFGGIERRVIAGRGWSGEPLPTGSLRMEVERDVPQRMMIIAFPMCGQCEDGFVGADLLTDILASGRSSRFYRRLLTGTELFTSVDASVAGLEENGYLMVTAGLRRREDAERAEAAVWGELRRVVEEDPTEEELQRALNRYESNYTFEQIHCMGRCQEMALAAMHGVSRESRLRDYLSSTPERIRAAAVDIIVPERSRTLIYG